MKSFILACLICLVGIDARSQSADEQQIREMLHAQVVAWNAGDIAGYMKGYWENDSLVFIGKNGPTYGYRATLERYRKAYPDAEAMGKLTSTIISMEKLAPDYFFIIGKWELKRVAGNLSGSYTLLLKKTVKGWVIVTDHSS